MLFTLPVTATTDIIAWVSGLFGDLLPLILLFLGIEVALLIMERIIGAVNNKKE